MAVAGAVLALPGVPPRAAETACRGAACVNLLFDGDSISAGAGATPGHGLDTQVAAALGGDTRLHNVAAGGRPVSECLELYPKLVAPLFDRRTPHNVIVFHAGDNDIAQGRDAAQTYAAFAAYVAAAHRQGWKVVVSTELRHPDWRPPTSTELTDYNQRLRANKAGADAVVDFNANPVMTTMSNRSDPALFHDALHPSDRGYAILADMLVPAVRRAAGR